MECSKCNTCLVPFRSLSWLRSLTLHTYATMLRLDKPPRLAPSAGLAIVLQVSDLRYVYNPLAESEKDTIVLVQVLKDGEWGPLRPNAFYRVATSNYLADGGDGCGLG